MALLSFFADFYILLLTSLVLLVSCEFPLKSHVKSQRKMYAKEYKELFGDLTPSTTLEEFCDLEQINFR